MNELTARVWQRGIFYCQPKYVDGDHGGIWGLSLTRCLQIRFWYWAVPRCPCKPSVAGYAVPQASSTCWITSHSAGFIYLCHVLNPVQHTDELFCILNISCDIFNCNTVKRCNGPIKWCGYLVSSRYCFGLNCPSESWFWPVSLYCGWSHYRPRHLAFAVFVLIRVPWNSTNRSISTGLRWSC